MATLYSNNPTRNANSLTSHNPTTAQDGGGGTAWTKNLADSVTLSDIISKAVGLSKSDTITLADSISKIPGLNISDSLILIDEINKTFGLNISDIVSLSDNRETSLTSPPVITPTPSGGGGATYFPTTIETLQKRIIAHKIKQKIQLRGKLLSPMEYRQALSGIVLARNEIKQHLTGLVVQDTLASQELIGRIITLISAPNYLGGRTVSGLTVPINLIGKTSSIIREPHKLHGAVTKEFIKQAILSGKVKGLTKDEIKIMLSLIEDDELLAVWLQKVAK